MTTFRPFANLAERKHRLPECGRIRLGQQVPTKSGKTRPSSLRTLRFTSPNRDSIDMLAKLYGGTVKPWDDQWEVVTETAEVPVVLPTEDPLGDTPTYELWDRGGLRRRCDGETAVCPVRVSDDEVAMQASPCVCNQRKLAECKVTVRLSVILPEVPFAGTWRLETHSWNAAEELPGMVDAVREFTSRGFLRAFLGLRVEEKMEAGKKKEFVVPYLRCDASLTEVLAGAGSLVAIPAGPEPTLEIGPGTPGQVAPGLQPSAAPEQSSGARPTGDGNSAGPSVSSPAGLVPCGEAKNELLKACDGDVKRMFALWAGRGTASIGRAELDGLIEEASIADAELVD